MDIEQLKLILNTLHDAGAGALVFGILWLAKDIVITLILATALPLFLLKCVRAVCASNQEITYDTRLVDRVAFAVRVSRPFVGAEKGMIERVIDMGIAAHQQANGPKSAL